MFELDVTALSSLGKDVRFWSYLGDAHGGIFNIGHIGIMNTCLYTFICVHTHAEAKAWIVVFIGFARPAPTIALGEQLSSTPVM